jgi:hypothetical protein
VVYWIANNVITFSQQYLIMRSQGYKPDVFGNIKAELQEKRKGEKRGGEEVMGRVSGLWRYPIKSHGREPLEHALDHPDLGSRSPSTPMTSRRS